MKNKINCTFSNYVFIIFLLYGKYSFCQTPIWQPQYNNSSCWAAATQNIFSRTFTGSAKNVKECDILFKKNTDYNWCDLASRGVVRGTDFSVESKEEYISIVKQYSSFSYLANGKATFDWNTLSSLKKPIIYSFDEENNSNHFVNIYFTKSFGIQKWIYIFDPLSNMHYLKNFKCYQIPSLNTGVDDKLQTTYYNFNIPTSGTTIATLQNGITSPNNYESYNETKIFNQVLNLYDSIPIYCKTTQNITGLQKSIRRSNIKLGNHPSFMEEFMSYTDVGFSEVAIPISISRTKIIPIFKVNGATIKFISILFILHETKDSPRAVVDKIQQFNMPDSFYSRISLSIDNTTNSVVYPENLKFNIGRDGRFRVELDGFYFNPYLDMPKWIPENELINQLFPTNDQSNWQTISISQDEFNSNNFSNILRSKNLEIVSIGNNDTLKINNKSIIVEDLQTQIKNKYSIDKVSRIILLKNKL